MTIKTNAKARPAILEIKTPARHAIKPRITQDADKASRFVDGPPAISGRHRPEYIARNAKPTPDAAA